MPERRSKASGTASRTPEQHARGASAAPDQHARAAYELFAPHYDAFTAHHDYERWTATLEGLARACGLHGRRLLDVACGTGKSFLPFLDRYEVTACDISPAMLQVAADKAGDRARLEVCDMRALPRLGAFDLVCCLDDAVNYLLTDEDLAAAFASVARLLAPGGVYVFDANSIATYRAGFDARASFERPRAAARWRGETTTPIGPGAVCAASIEIAGTAAVSRHVQRHHPEPAIRHALASAGLSCRAVLGQSTGGVLHGNADEESHTKLVYLAGRAG
jgi:SAM-dependent methyltransferase